jgi:hypothetical protein
MIKAVSLTLGLILLMDSSATLRAQNSPTDTAVNEAVLRQADTIVLRQRLDQAKSALDHGDLPAAARFYQAATDLVEQIGPAAGIDAEKAQAIAGLSSTWLTLARQAQDNQNYLEAEKDVNLVLRANPQDPAALAFKKQIDRTIQSLRGRIPDAATMEEIPGAMAQKTDAATLAQDGRVLYEMGKFDEAQVKLELAMKLDPDNQAAFYYLNLIKEAKYSRQSEQHTIDTKTRMNDVEKQWVLPVNDNLPNVSNPYADTNLIYTGPGRQTIMNKLDRIHLDSVSYDGLPLSEVLRSLSEQTRLRDPERKGINFLIDPNPDNSGPAIASTTLGGFPGAAPQAFTPPAAAIDPTTGLPITQTGGANGGNGSESVDVNSVIIKLALDDVRLADVLDAIVTVADHPIKYSVQDYAVVFSTKGAETPQLFTRRFKVDPNTFYSGLESVGASSFGSVSSSGGSGGSGGGGGGGGGGANGQNNNGAVIGVVNAFSGAGSIRNTGNGSGGGGGGGGGNGQGSANPLGTAGAGGTGTGGGNINANGGLRYVTQVNLASDVSAAARAFFTTLGVNLTQPPGKSVFFNDKLGLLVVRATQDDLDTIEQAIQALNQVAPQVHIKARFIEVQQSDDKALGFDWYLGNFINGTVVANGGSAPSLTVPTSAANPLGAFPGNTAASVIPGSATDQQVTSGLRNSAPAIATVTGILTDPNFRVVLHALEQRTGFETLAEPEVTTTSGRQTQMRATQIINVVTGFNFQQGTGGITTGTGGTTQ